MGKLKVLPAQIANLIAAGEVVQRPSSVVKELLENAVDAGASQISVFITDSGRTLIQVIDNGCGMSAADAVLCFERHATSKIAEAEDLQDILTYGFRGEALPSIAAVSEVTLRTRRESDQTATKVSLTEGSPVKTSTCSAPIGSNFEIRNLFYNTPARRKFLKSDTVEFKHIVEEFSRVAIPHPEIAFNLTHNGREIFVLKKAKSLKFRILDVLGSNVVGDIVDISAVTTSVTVNGFLGRPEGARKTLGNQYFFACGRFFRSPYLHKAVMKAYEELVPDGMTPSYFIFLELDPSSIDVNIHPTKTEIKFEDDGIMFQTLYACVRETLGRNSFGASIDFDESAAVQMPQMGRNFDEYHAAPLSPNVSFDENYNPFEAHHAETASPKAPSFRDHITAHEDYGALFEQKSVTAPKAFVVQGRFVVTPCSSGIMIVNVRRAWERILYERALNAFSDGGHVTQTALFPIQVQVGVERRLLFEEHMPMLSQLGFDITTIDNDSICVGGVPEGYSCEPGKVEAMLEDLALILTDNGSALPEMMHQRMAEKIATLGSCHVEAPSSPVQAQGLLDALFACENAELTASGRRILNILGLPEIENRF